MNFGLPDSIRPLSPAEPIGSIMSFTNMLPDGTLTSVSNQLANFGQEYVWHCHILSHEENDMMRPIKFTVTTALPAVPVLTVTTAGGNTLSWTDATPAATSIGNAANEVGFQIQRAGITGAFTVLGKVPANKTTFIDGTATAGTVYRYVVNSFNNKGTSANSNIVTVTTATTVPLPAVPALTSPAAGVSMNTAATIPFVWAAVTGADFLYPAGTVRYNRGSQYARFNRNLHQSTERGALSWFLYMEGKRHRSPRHIGFLSRPDHFQFPRQRHRASRRWQHQPTAAPYQLRPTSYSPGAA